MATRRLPVYWVGPADGEQLLFREFRDAAERSAAVDPIAAAAGLMTASRPEDPDYRTLWSPAEEVGIATSPDGTITVDLPAEAFRSGLDEGEARLVALQQLAHTVTATARAAGLLSPAVEAEVVVLVDGRPRAEVFGSVRLDEPLWAEEELEAPVWLLDPQQGAHPAGAVTVAGRTLEEVRGCRWTVTDPDGGTVRSGDVELVPRGDGTAEFRAELELAPGAYRVTVLGRDDEGTTVRDDKDVEVLPR